MVVKKIKELNYYELIFCVHIQNPFFLFCFLKAELQPSVGFSVNNYLHFGLFL